MPIVIHVDFLCLYLLKRTFFSRDEVRQVCYNPNLDLALC